MDGGTGVFLLFVGLAALVCFLLGWWFYRINGQRLFIGRSGRKALEDSSQDPLILFEWFGLIMAALAFGPQTKMRHMIVFLPIVLLAVRYLVVATPGVARWPLLVATLLAFFFQIWPFNDWGAGGIVEEHWRYNGGPMWFFLLMFFTVLWTGLRTVKMQARGEEARALE